MTEPNEHQPADSAGSAADEVSTLQPVADPDATAEADQDPDTDTESESDKPLRSDGDGLTDAAI